MIRPTLLVLALAAPLLAGCLAETDDPVARPEGCSATSRGAPDLCDNDVWLNTPDGEPLTLQEDLKGRVVVIDFWTYTCINCLRTLPHLNAWYDVYEPYGLTIVGVHAPEFEFEKERENVEQAVEDLEIDHPVVLDNDMQIWSNYANRYWPAKYVLDARGELVYKHFGEGKYAETEAILRDLLRDAGAKDLPPPLEDPDLDSERGSSITPELYAGTWRQSWTVGNPEGYRPGEDVPYTLPAYEDRGRDRLYLDGTWNNGYEALTSRTDGTVVLRFQAGAANFVAEPGSAGCVPVTLDGAPVPAELRGADIQQDGDGTCIPLEENRSYDVYNGPVETHELEFHVPEGFALYSFAFSAYAYGRVP